MYGSAPLQVWHPRDGYWEGLLVLPKKLLIDNQDAVADVACSWMMRFCERLEAANVALKARRPIVLEIDPIPPTDKPVTIGRIRWEIEEEGVNGSIELFEVFDTISPEVQISLIQDWSRKIDFRSKELERQAVVRHKRPKRIKG